MAQIAKAHRQRIEDIGASEGAGVSDLSDYELGLIRHALGWPKMYRNHYAACPGTSADFAWSRLVERGLARGPISASYSPDNFYSVTPGGIALATTPPALED